MLVRRSLRAPLAIALLASTALACGGGSSNAPTDGGSSSDDASTTTGSDDGGTTTKSTTGTDANADTATPVGTPASAASYFPSDLYFNQPVDGATLDPQSGTLISNLDARGGWGNSNVFQIDYSIDVYYADASSRLVPFVDGGIATPDSDIPSKTPLHPSKPVGFESSSGYTCDGGDCHYLVMDIAHHMLIEFDQASFDGTSISSNGSIAMWDWKKSYLGSLRGDICTSADASGGMMAPLLFTAEEVSAGHIDHAIRFILPNDRIQWKEYVRPATHGTGRSTTAGWAASNGVPYGARFRLKSSYDTSKLPKGAQVVAAALKKYGMILSDGGKIALTAKSDQFGATKWSGLLGPRDLSALKVTDFDVVAGTYGSDHESSTKRHDFTAFDCVRNP